MNFLLTTNQTIDADNPIEGDLHLTANQITLTADRRTATRQHLTNRLRFFLSEWFLDVRQGIPFFQRVFVKGVNPSVVRSIFRRVIRETPGVAGVEKLSLTIDRPTRESTISFEAPLDDTGDPLVFEDLVIGDI